MSSMRMTQSIDLINMTNRKFSMDLLDFIQDSAEFLQGHLLIPNKITIFLDYSREMDGCSGQCSQLGVERTTEINIELNTAFLQRNHDDLREVAKLLIHEMVHAEQYASGRMLDHGSQSTVTTFDGKDYPKKMRYSTMPWEIEANRLETGLLLELVLPSEET